MLKAIHKMWKKITITLFFLSFIVGLYLVVFYIPWANKAMENISTKENLGSMMTIDGLLTTATFAFIAFISISPNSSGSSIAMNHVAWKGIWFFRYSFLLILTVLITILNFLISFGHFVVLVGVGTILSSIILITIIIKYSLNNKNLNETSAKKIAYIITNPYSEKLFKKSFRNLIHPLRATANADFLKEILVSKYFIYDIAKLILGDVKIKNKNNKNKDKKFALMALHKFFSIIRSNTKLTITQKMEISIWIHLKIISNENIDYNGEDARKSNDIFEKYYAFLVEDKKIFY